MKTLFAIPLMLLAVGAGFAQEADSAKAPETAAAGPNLAEAIENVNGKVEGLNESFLETKAIADKLNKIKVSGYVQAQWQYADSIGVQSVAGGNFTANSQERFQVRRGRLKTTYETATSRYVLQFDVIPAGVSIKDAYATWMEPWLKTFSGTAGVFDRPFGFEIGYSSGSREAPERSRMYQTLFPGERDLGVKLEIAPQSGIGQYLNFKGGLFTGMGPTANEIDNAKDAIGRLGFTAPFYDLNLSIDGGFSAYLGSVLNVNDTLMTVGKKGTSDTLAFVPTTGKRLQEIDRTVMGVDLQAYYDLPVIGGLSLRGEYLWGEQPGISNSGAVYTGTPAATPATPNPAAPRVFSREFMGWYLAWIQNLGPKFQSVVRFDVYDPNTKVEGKDVFLTGTGTSAADLQISTLGLGLVYHWDDATKLTAYYDMVENETSNAPASATAASKAWNSDLSDNVFTLRMQTRF